MCNVLRRHLYTLQSDHLHKPSRDEDSFKKLNQNTIITTPKNVKYFNIIKQDTRTCYLRHIDKCLKHLIFKHFSERIVCYTITA